MGVHTINCSGESIERPLEDPRPVWLCHGSSITHVGPIAASPSCTWVSLCSRLANVRLINLGFGGECYLDQAVARVIRDTKCDCITLKVGINIQAAAAMTER